MAKRWRRDHEGHSTADGQEGRDIDRRKGGRVRVLGHSCLKQGDVGHAGQPSGLDRYAESFFTITRDNVYTEDR